MRPEEAQWVGEQLDSLLPEKISPLIELGSSTRTFRTIGKPHIDRFVHVPLKERSVKIVHTDMKRGDGIDISGDIYSAPFRLCYEALTQTASFVAISSNILRIGRRLLVYVTPFYSQVVLQSLRFCGVIQCISILSTRIFDQRPQK